MHGRIRICSGALAFALALGAGVGAADTDGATAAQEQARRDVLNRKPEEVRRRPVKGAAESVSGGAQLSDSGRATSLNAPQIRDALAALGTDVMLANDCSVALAAAATDGPSAIAAVASMTLPDAALYRRPVVTKGPPRPQHGTSCTAANLQDLLIEERRAFRFLKKWAGRCDKDQACKNADADLRADVDVLQRQINDVLEREGLREPFVAELVSGLAFGTPPENSEENTEKLPAGFIRWRSNPFGFGYDAERDLDFTFGGRFGYMPALTLVEPSANASGGGSGEKKGETLEYQEAFGWDLRFNARRHFGDRVQFVASGGGGQVILNSTSSIGKRDGKDALFTIVPNGVGRAAWFYDGHIAFRYFKSNRDVRADQQSINPGFEMSLGVRHDTRFKKDDKTSLVAYDAPERRFLFRMMLSDLRVLDRRKPKGSKEAPTFVITFGIEHEFGGSNGLPSVTRIVLVGDMALLKALNGSRK